MAVEIIIHIFLKTCSDVFFLVLYCDDSFKTYDSPEGRDFRHWLGSKLKYLENGQSSFEHRNKPERKRTKGNLISPDDRDVGRKDGNPLNLKNISSSQSEQLICSEKYIFKG